MAANINNGSYVAIFQNSGYIHVRNESYNGRKIIKYILEDTSETSLNLAVQSINNLLSSYPNLCATFSILPIDTLRMQIQQKKYLTINNDAVCLSNELEAPYELFEYKDKYFSQAVLINPISCTKGHLLEKNSVEFWVEKNGYFCPDPRGKHSIESLEVDEEVKYTIIQLKEKIQKAKGDYDNKFGELEKAEENLNIKCDELDKKVSELNLIAMSGFASLSKTLIEKKLGHTNITPIGSGVCKLLIKTAGKDVILALGKIALKEGGQQAIKGVIKFIPVVSLFIGIGCAIYRFINAKKVQDYVKGIGELVSGATACIPVYGTSISVACDIIIGSHDIYDAYQTAANIQVDIKSAYKILSLDDTLPPSMEEVDAAYKKMAIPLHPDRIQEFGKFIAANMNNIITVLNVARDSIYKARNWK